MSRVALVSSFALFLTAQAECQITAQQDSGQTDTAVLTTRSIEGRVLSSAGIPVPGAVVLIKDGKTLQVRSYIAQKEGVYHFFGLSTEVNYELRAESGSFTSKEKTLSVFDSHKKVKLDLKLSQKKSSPKRKKGGA